MPVPTVIYYEGTSLMELEKETLCTLIQQLFNELNEERRKHYDLQIQSIKDLAELRKKG